MFLGWAFKFSGDCVRQNFWDLIQQPAEFRRTGQHGADTAGLDIVSRQLCPLPQPGDSWAARATGTMPARLTTHDTTLMREYMRPAA